MLKVAFNQEEREGAALMVWWEGVGAATVLAHDEEALLLERAEGSRSLARMSLEGNDNEASRILCAVVQRLHSQAHRAPPRMLAPLPVWFRQLEPAAARVGGILVQAAATARELLATGREVCVLHGDIHHDNVLDFGDRGWLVIDPKGLHGERTFDYLNLFCNPWPQAKKPGRLRRQLEVVSAEADIDPGRLLRWILAYAGLSAAWTMDDGGDAANALEIASIASAELAL